MSVVSALLCKSRRKVQVFPNFPQFLFVMALYYDLPVFKEVYQMTLKIFQFTSNFPREYKFTLGQDLKRDCIVLVRYIYRANKTKEKTVYLEQFLDSFEIVKLEIRLCRDLHLLTIKQQASLVENLDSIGKQITAWRNATKENK